MNYSSDNIERLHLVELRTSETVCLSGLTTSITKTRNFVDVCHIQMLACLLIFYSVTIDLLATALFYTFNAICRVLDLPDDIIFKLFDYCDIQTLGRLACVCIRLCQLVKRDCVWLTWKQQFTCVGNSSSNGYELSVLCYLQNVNFLIIACMVHEMLDKFDLITSVTWCISS